MQKIAASEVLDAGSPVINVQIERQIVNLLANAGRLHPQLDIGPDDEDISVADGDVVDVEAEESAE